jgi:selenoprotein W-related protein
MKPSRITIEYCVECLYLPRAIALAQALLQDFPDQIAEVALIPGHEGVFDVSLDGKKIFAMEGVLPQPASILKRMGEALSGGAPA